MMLFLWSNANETITPFFRLITQPDMKKKEKAPIDPRIEKVADKLKKLRKDKGFTSYENFALDKDLPRVQYWRLEKGANFTFTTLLKVLDAHQITLEQFFKGLK
jgi:hypothetical protein